MLKYHRQQQGLRQDDLAGGICTPSYLSRIENGVVIAGRTVYEMLLADLGIDFAEEKEGKSVLSLYEEFHAYKQASVFLKRAFIASEKVRYRMGS